MSRSRKRSLRIRNKLALTFIILLLPLLGGELLAIRLLADDLREGARLELTNIVDHLHQLCVTKAPHLSPASGDQVQEDMAPIKDLIRGFHVGKTGYVYVMDSQGNLLVHPTMEGENILDSRDSHGFEFIRSVCQQAGEMGPQDVGTIRYPWGDEAAGGPRMKILQFKYLRAWDWIIVAGAYEEEVYASLGRFEMYMGLLVGMSLLLVVALTLALNRIITHPLDQVAGVARKMAEGDLSHKVQVTTSDELGDLAAAFNAMADQVRDKTENLELLVRKRTEALGESRERYRSLVESTVDGIVTTDEHGHITYVNPGFEAIVGSTRAEATGQPIWRFYREGRGQAEKVMGLLREQGNLTSFEMELIGDGRIIPIRTSASILRDAEGRERGTLGIFTDQTARKQLEAKLEQTQAELVQTMKLRALGDLVSGVAHEINNPLMASTTILHVMSKSYGDDDSPNARRVAVLQRCNERVARIVDHLREFSRQAEMEHVAIDVNETIDNALIITGQQLLNLQIVIERNLAPELPEVLGDANHLEQVFLDMIANARDAMESCERRELRISTRVEQQEGRGVVVVAISDSGPGVPSEVRDKIFEPFFTTKEIGKGTGLGLAICYGIIQEHGGRIQVEDNPLGGATFNIVLPVAENPAPPPNEA